MRVLFWVRFLSQQYIWQSWVILLVRESECFRSILKRWNHVPQNAYYGPHFLRCMIQLALIKILTVLVILFSNYKSSIGFLPICSLMWKLVLWHFILKYFLGVSLWITKNKGFQIWKKIFYISTSMAIPLVGNFDWDVLSFEPHQIFTVNMISVLPEQNCALP